MSLVEHTSVDSWRTIRNRLRYPPNAVCDDGIDLKREPPPPPTPYVFRGMTDDEYVAWLMPQPEPEPEPEPAPEPLTTRAIQRAVCQHYGIALNDMLSIRRQAVVVLPRHVAMYLCKELTTRTFPELGRSFGGRDHTTIINGVRRITAKIESNPDVAETVGYLLAKLRPADDGSAA